MMRINKNNYSRRYLNNSHQTNINKNSRQLESQNSSKSLSNKKQVLRKSSKSIRIHQKFINPKPYTNQEVPNKISSWTNLNIKNTKQIPMRDKSPPRLDEHNTKLSQKNQQVYKNNKQRRRILSVKSQHSILKPIIISDQQLKLPKKHIKIRGEILNQKKRRFHTISAESNLKQGYLQLYGRKIIPMKLQKFSSAKINDCIDFSISDSDLYKLINVQKDHLFQVIPIQDSQILQKSKKMRKLQQKMKQTACRVIFKALRRIIKQYYINLQLCI